MQMQHLTHKSVSLALHSLEFLHKSSVFLIKQSGGVVSGRAGLLASSHVCVRPHGPDDPPVPQSHTGPWHMLTLLIAALEDSVPLRWNISSLPGHDLTSLRQRLNGFSSRAEQEERRKKETWSK